MIVKTGEKLENLLFVLISQRFFFEPVVQMYVYTEQKLIQILPARGLKEIFNNNLLLL